MVLVTSDRPADVHTRQQTAECALYDKLITFTAGDVKLHA